jgi:HK97 family phage prohead protease
MQHHFNPTGEFKLAGDGQSEMMFSGHAAVFNNVDMGGDMIAPGAFADTIKEAKTTGNWPAMLLQHGGGFLGTAEDQTPIGVWTDLKEDDKGLFVEGKLAPTARGRDIYQLLKMQPRPAMSGMSIGYVPKEWAMRAQAHEPRRTLKKVHLFEASLVTRPMNPRAQVANVKSDTEALREFERLLTHDAGFSRSEARQIINAGFKSFLAMRDAGGGEPEVSALAGLAATIRNAIN